MSNSHEIAKNLVDKIEKNEWHIDVVYGTISREEFEKHIQQVLAYELSEAPADFEAEPELQFP